MKRHAAAIVALLLVSAPQLHAQSIMFKVDADAANVHKAPSTGSPIIGKAPHGAMLPVTRELGSWVKISWPQAQDGVGYVHVSTGSLARAAAADERAQPESTARPAASASSIPPPPPPPPARRVARTETTAAPAPPARVRAPSHQLGVGGVMAGPDLAVGAAARAWSRSRVGLQVDFSRASLGGQPRATSTELTPSVIYGFRDRVQDYWWLRPYVGAGPTFERRGFDNVPPGDPLAQSALGFQAFGGGEVTFASLPRFAVSLDLGYRWSEALAGVDRSGVRVAVSGHWYLR